MSKIRIISLATSTISLCLLLLILNYTTPVTAGPFGVVLVFVLIYMSLFSLVAGILYSISKLISRLFGFIMPSKPIMPLSLRKSYYFSIVISASPVIIVALYSVGQVSWYEYILVFLFIITSCTYIYKKTS